MRSRGIACETELEILSLQLKNFIVVQFSFWAPEWCRFHPFDRYITIAITCLWENNVDDDDDEDDDDDDDDDKDEDEDSNG